MANSGYYLPLSPTMFESVLSSVLNYVFNAFCNPAAKFLHPSLDPPLESYEVLLFA